jgi:hypothetical protein
MRGRCAGDARGMRDALGMRGRCAGDARAMRGCAGDARGMRGRCAVRGGCAGDARVRGGCAGDARAMRGCAGDARCAGDALMRVRLAVKLRKGTQGVSVAPCRRSHAVYCADGCCWGFCGAAVAFAAVAKQGRGSSPVRLLPQMVSATARGAAGCLLRSVLHLLHHVFDEALQHCLRQVECDVCCHE